MATHEAMMSDGMSNSGKREHGYHAYHLSAHYGLVVGGG